MAWIRFDDNLLDDPEVAELERRRRHWPMLWVDLAALARGSGDTDGRVLFAPGKPWTVAQLAYRRRVTVREYQRFVDAAEEIGILEQHPDGGFCLPARWSHLWSSGATVSEHTPKTTSSSAMSNAERQARYRDRKRQDAPQELEATMTTAAPRNPEAASSVISNDMSRPSVTCNARALRDVTDERNAALRSNVTCNDYMTEQKPERDINKHGTQIPDLGSLTPQTPIPDFDEERFWQEIAKCYEHFVGKTWTGADKLKAIQTLRQPWATSQPNWLIRYYAFLAGLQHMATAKNVANRWGYALSMAHKYADIADEFVVGNARRKAAGNPQISWQFRRIDPIEDCYGPDYERRGDEAPKEEVA